MGKGDRRNSNKMLRRRSRARMKGRSNRPKNPARAPVVREAAPPPTEAAEQPEEQSE